MHRINHNKLAPIATRRAETGMLDRWIRRRQGVEDVTFSKLSVRIVGSHCMMAATMAFLLPTFTMLRWPFFFFIPYTP